MKKLIPLVILCLIFSCSKINLFDTDNSTIEKKIDLGVFKNIIVEDIFTVNIISDTTNFAFIRSRENQMNKIHLSENNSSLTLSHSNYSWTDRNNNIVIDIHSSNIKNISLESPCTLNIPQPLKLDKLTISALASAELIEGNLNIDVKEFVFHSYGNIYGKLNINGTCLKSTIILNGAININAENFKAKNISLSQNSIGELKVWATESLNINVYCSGNIYYKGNIVPTIKTHQINNQKPDAKIIKIEN